MCTRSTSRPSLRASALSAALAVLFGSASLALGAAPAHAQATPTAAPTPPRSACDVVTRMGVRPDIVPAGQDARITATLAFSCPGSETARRHIVLVADASSSMAGQPRQQLSKAMSEFIDRTPLEDGRIRIAIVQYKASAQVLCPMTNDRSALAACILQVEASGGSCIDCGVTAAYDELVRVRGDVPTNIELNESVIVVTDGANADGCDQLKAKAALAKADRILVITVALSDGGDVACMRAAATSPRYFFELRQAGQFGNVFDTIRKQLMNGKIVQVAFRFTPSDGLPVVPDSIGWPGELEPDGSVYWLQQMVPTAGITVSLSVRPTVAGAVPALADARGELLDNRGAVAPITFDIPGVVALGDGALPTVTPAAPSRVRSNGLTLSPPQPRPGERARLDYRFALDDPVDPQGSHVMIVADTSGSMAGEPIAALRSATRGLVARLPLGDDPSLKFGIVTFTLEAKLLVGLTDSRPELDAAIGRFSAAGGTCVDCGLRAGRDALAAGRPAPGVEDLIVLSDGENNKGCAPVLAEANAIKEAGITVHAVCLGRGCDAYCMSNAASPGHYHEAPASADLGETFAAITDELIADRRYDAVAVRLVMPPHLRLVPGSFGRTPDVGSDAFDARWTFRPLPFAPLSLSGEVEAMADGDVPAVAVSEGLERGGRVVRWVAEAPRTVPTPVATPLPSTVTPTPSAEATGVPAATTASTTCSWLYLPAAMRMP